MGRLLHGIVLWGMPLLLTLPAAAHAEQTIVFYDPDANFEVVPRALQGLNTYLAQELPGFHLTITGDAGAMLKAVNLSRAPYAIAAEEYFGGDPGSATPLLIAETRGSIFYHKVLVDRGAGAPGDLRNRRIAAASGDPSGPSAGCKVLGTLRRAGVNVDGALFLGTTKDIDALLAVVFSQADAAMVTSTSLDRLRKVNPGAAAEMRAVWRSADILRPPLLTIKSFETSAERNAVLEAFKNIPNDPVGRVAMQALGLDRWMPYSGEGPNQEKRP